MLGLEKITGDWPLFVTSPASSRVRKWLYKALVYCTLPTSLAAVASSYKVALFLLHLAKKHPHHHPPAKQTNGCFFHTSNFLLHTLPFLPVLFETKIPSIPLVPKKTPKELTETSSKSSGRALFHHWSTFWPRIARQSPFLTSFRRWLPLLPPLQQRLPELALGSSRFSNTV